jgi:Protein kinase domain/AAA domain
VSEPDNPEDASGRVIDGRWAVVGATLEGGMASVVEGFDLAGEHGRVAVKLLAAATDDKWRRGGFEREQQALARLDHPNIVRLLHVGRDPATDDRYLVFPWLETRLQDRMAELGAMPWERWWDEYGEPIVNALEVIHRQDVSHRDLKPANIMLDARGVPVIIDFGIAKLRRQVAPELTVAGQSLPFTPPETTPLKYMATRDVFAWGALTVFAVSGADPYPADDREPAEVLSAAEAVARERLPRFLLPVVARCLSEQPSARPQTAGVLLADVAAALETDRKRSTAARGQRAPTLHLYLPRKARESLEVDRDLFPAEVDELVSDDLAGEHAVLPYLGEDKDYVLVGTELSLHVRADEAAGQLVVLGAASQPEWALERDRSRGWPGPIRVSTAPVTDREAAGRAIGFVRREVAAHEAERRAAEQRNRRARPVKVWRSLLSLLRSLETAREDPISYRDARITKNGLAFTLRRDAPKDLVAQRRVAPTGGERNIVGDIVSVAGDEVIMRVNSGNRHDVLPTGELRLDTRAQITAIERQQRALDAVEYGRARRPDLGRLLTEPASASEPRPILGLSFTQPLDDPKQRAVETALGSIDLLLVQGPPGTGKTTFITELILQELARDPDTRVLISSQAHAGLDNALSVLHRRDETVRLLRLGRADDERVSPHVAELLLERRLADWKRYAVASGSAWLRRWAKNAGVSVADVEAAMSLRELAAHLDRMSDARIDLANGEAELLSLRAAARRAAPAATAPTLLRARAAELDELRESIASIEGQTRDLPLARTCPRSR